MLPHIHIWIINELWLHHLKIGLTHNMQPTTTAARINVVTALSTSLLILQMISVPLTTYTRATFSVLCSPYIKLKCLSREYTVRAQYLPCNA